jgi:hypothetical protein
MKDMLAGAPSWVLGTLGSLVLDCSRRIGLRLWLTIALRPSGVPCLVIKAECEGEDLVANLRCADEGEALGRLQELAAWVQTWSTPISASVAEG